MGVTLTDVLLFGKAQSDDVDNATLVIYRRNILRWSALGGYLDVIVKGVAPLSLPDAIADSLSYVKAFGGTYQGNIPNTYTQVNYVTNTAQTAVDTGIMIDFAKNYEFEVECRAVSGSWYILQSRASASGNVTGIHGATSGSTIILVVGNVTVCTSAITRTVGNKLYVKATLNAGTATLYVKDETANTEDTQTGSYGTTQPNPTASVYLLGNAGEQYVDVNSDIYMARIKENDTVVMDYVPARQVATAGFYDTVSGTFKTALTPANLSADGNTVPTPDAPMDIVSNNGALKFGKLLTLDSTRYYAYIYTNDNWNYSNDSYSIVVPVIVGHKYKITVPTTNPLNGVQNVIFRYGFVDTINEDWKNDDLPVQPSIPLYDWVRTTPQDTPTVEITATRPYMIIQMGATAFSYILANNLITIIDQCIYTDGLQETIGIRTKNLFDKDSVTMGVMINANTGAEAASLPNRYSSDYIIVKPNTVYSCNGFDDTSGAYGVAYYDKNKVFVSGESYGSTIVVNKKITVPNNSSIKYIRFCSYAITSIDDCMFVESNVLPADYVPYFDGGTATAEMLLKVGDYQDVQSILDGVITRKVGVKVLDGTETWVASSTYQGSCYVARFLSPAPSQFPFFYCSHFEVVRSISDYGRGKCLISGSESQGGWVELDIWYGDNRTTAVADLKTFLATQYANGTPVIVVYPLATATTESVTGQTLQVTDGDNVLKITQASLNKLELEAEYQAAVSLTIQEVQDANLDPNVEVTIN